MIGGVENTPKLRFPEFSGEWSSTTLGEISDCLDKKRIPLKEGDRSQRRGVYPYYGASGVIDHIDDYLFDEPLVLLAEDGANILLRSTPVAFIADGKFWVNNHAHVYRAHGSTRFLAEILEKIDYTKFNTGTAQPKLNGEVCKKLPLAVPKLPEQQKIAVFLGAVDLRIGQLTRKKALLEDYKKGCMQQLFTQKLRFNDDQGNDFPDWEEKKLGEVASYKAGQFVQASMISDKQAPQLFPCYGANGLRGYTESKTHSGHHTLIGRQGALCGNVQLVSGDFHATEHAIVVSPNDSANVVWLFYELGRLKLNRFATGQAQPGVSVDTIVQLKTAFPHPDEQQKIADFLSAIDAKISLVSDQLTQAQAFKKGLLQHMFV